MFPQALSGEAAELFDRISRRPNAERAQVVAEAERLASLSSLAWSLRALFRQQVQAGYVLFDPHAQAPEEKRFEDPEFGLALQLQWNPARELRKHHHLLLERGVLVKAADPSKLVNRNARGIGCYLCHENMAQQNPGEITLRRPLAGEPYYLGANFAPIADNHFTVMSGVHRPQRYHAGVVRAGLELVAATGGAFRALFNGLAGASIEEHEHLQATDARFPIEALRARTEDVLWEAEGARLAMPPYYLPLWLAEGQEIAPLVRICDLAIRAWQRLDPERHTENLIITRGESGFRVFILLRDRARLAAPERHGAMASFEAGGLIVLSEAPEAGPVDERRLFQTATLPRVRRLLTALRPEREPPSAESFLQTPRLA